VSDQEPEYIRRRRAAEGSRATGEHNRLEERKYRIDRITGLGIWAAALIALGAIAETHCSSERQFAAMASQQQVMQGQLDTMIAQQRPWISAKPRLDLSLMLMDWGPNQDPTLSLSIPVTVDLKNHGPSPATNIVIHSMLIPAAPHDTDLLNKSQEDLCTKAEQSAKTAKKIGISVFPGEEKRGPAAGSIPVLRNSAPVFYIMQGCVEYTYNGTLHGKTGYRMYLGHINEGTHLWEGFAWRTDSQEAIPDAGVVYRMQPKGIDFRETDDGGNWAR
jgi:hypothetical protein